MALRDRISALLSPAWRARAARAERRLQGWVSRVGPARALARRAHLPLALRRPGQVGLEVTSACNARCIMCPRHEMDRPMRPMDLGLFRKVVDECADLGVPEIALNGYGDIFTLTHGRYRDYIGYVRERAPAAHVVINTNGQGMDEEAARYLVASGVHAVHTDIDGATAPTFERIREHLSLAQVEANVLRLVRRRDAAGKRRPAVRVGIITMPQNRHEIPQFLAKWRGRVDCVEVDGLANRVPGIDPSLMLNQGRPCYELWSKLQIWANGHAVLCCEDWNGTHVVGDARTQSIGEIWTGGPLQSARPHHLAGTARSIAMCRNCNAWRPGPYWWFDDWGPAPEPGGPAA